MATDGESLTAQAEVLIKKINVRARRHMYFLQFALHCNIFAAKISITRIS